MKCQKLKDTIDGMYSCRRVGRMLKDLQLEGEIDIICWRNGYISVEGMGGDKTSTLIKCSDGEVHVAWSVEFGYLAAGDEPISFTGGYTAFDGVDGENV